MTPGSTSTAGSSAQSLPAAKFSPALTFRWQPPVGLTGILAALDKAGSKAVWLRLGWLAGEIWFRPLCSSRPRPARRGELSQKHKVRHGTEVAPRPGPASLSAPFLTRIQLTRGSLAALFSGSMVNIPGVMETRWEEERANLAEACCYFHVPALCRDMAWHFGPLMS